MSNRTRVKTGTVYLLHFTSRLHHAGHYLGFVAGKKKALTNRLNKHRDGTGARLLEVIGQQGIDFVLARTWTGMTRADERRLKKRKNAPRLCPVCRSMVSINRMIKEVSNECSEVL